MTYEELELREMAFIAKVKQEARNEALNEASVIALQQCHCAPYWKPYGRVDPACSAHDISDLILELKGKS